MTLIAQPAVSFADGSTVDPFGKLRISQATPLFQAQFTYGLLPTLYEALTNGSGATVTHDATNRQALMTFASTPTGGKAYLQTYETFRYQPGSGHVAHFTCNMVAQVANVLKFVGYSDGVNGVEFQNTGAVNQFIVYSGTTLGNQTAVQSSWNIDKFDGTGASGLTLDITKQNSFVIDFQNYVGRIRVGLVVNGLIYYVHQFFNSNLYAYPFIQSLNLPLRAGMTCTGTVSTTMSLCCCAVETEARQEATTGYEFTQEGTVTASSGAWTHVLSIRPKTTFNSIVNRIHVEELGTDMLVTGNNPVRWALAIGQAISGTTTFNDVNTTYSAMEYNTAGTISGSAAILFDSGYIASSQQSKGSVGVGISARYPLTLDAAGAQRALGTLSLLAYGIGGASALRGSICWKEIS